MCPKNDNLLSIVALGLALVALVATVIVSTPTACTEIINFLTK